MLLRSSTHETGETDVRRQNLTDVVCSNVVDVVLFQTQRHHLVVVLQTRNKTLTE